MDFCFDICWCMTVWTLSRNQEYQTCIIIFSLAIRNHWSLDPDHYKDTTLDTDSSREQFQGLDQAPGLFQGSPNSGPHQGLNGNSQNHGFIPNPSFGLDPTLGLNSEIGLNPNQGFNYENGLNPNQGFNFGNRVEPNPVYDTEFFSYDELNVESGSKPIRQVIINLQILFI